MSLRIDLFTALFLHMVKFLTTALWYHMSKRKAKTFYNSPLMHKHDYIDETSGEAMKPEMITIDNSSKGGVDVVDRLKS